MSTETAEREPVRLEPCEPGQLTPDELKTLFLFEKLSDEQLAWVSAHGCTMRVPAGGLVLREGDPAESFFVLLSGTISLSRRIGQDDVQTTRTEQRGVYMGATQAYLRDDGVPRAYMASMRALDDSDFFVLSAADFGWMMREWFPMAIHLLEGLALGMRDRQAAIGERQRLAALGALSAGLMHELNKIENVRVRTRCEVISAHGDGHLQAITICDSKNGMETTMECGYLFVFIGAEPRTDWLGDTVARDEKGFIYTGPDLLRNGTRPTGWDRDRDPFYLECSVPGIFAAGDVRANSVKRVASAVGEGAMAVTLVHRYLEAQ